MTEKHSTAIQRLHAHHAAILKVKSGALCMGSREKGTFMDMMLAVARLNDF